MESDYTTLNKLLKPYKNKSQLTDNVSGIEPQDLSLHRNVLLVNDRIWVPKALVTQFYHNLHLGHRSMSTMLTLAGRICYWQGMRQDLETF